MAVDFKKVLQKPLIASEDMPQEMSAEVVEIVTAAVDKFISTENYEVRLVVRDAFSTLASWRFATRMHKPTLQKAAQSIKDGLDKKLGPTWHCAVGEGFGFNITFNAHHMLYVYYGEKLGILVFKA